jgi:hypothetical protein
MVLILGTSNPLEVLVMSSKALASGVCVPMPTFWENKYMGQQQQSRIINFMVSSIYFVHQNSLIP